MWGKDNKIGDGNKTEARLLSVQALGHANVPRIGKCAKPSLCIITHMNSAGIVRRLESEGWRKVHQTGSHIKFKHPEKPGAVTVPHPKKDLPIGTLRSIYRQAGWQWR